MRRTGPARSLARQALADRAAAAGVGDGSTHDHRADDRPAARAVGTALDGDRADGARCAGESHIVGAAPAGRPLELSLSATTAARDGGSDASRVVRGYLRALPDAAVALS